MTTTITKVTEIQTITNTAMVRHRNKTCLAHMLDAARLNGFHVDNKTPLCYKTTVFFWFQTNKIDRQKIVAVYSVKQASSIYMYTVRPSTPFTDSTDWWRRWVEGALDCGHMDHRYMPPLTTCYDNDVYGRNIPVQWQHLQHQKLSFAGYSLELFFPQKLKQSADFVYRFGLQ